MKKKISSPSALRKRIKNLQKKRKKIVFTNGCFDILHKGHVVYLEKAKNLGDYLVVALNSDPSVRKLKGKGRPINSLSDRMTVMSALGSVDFVTWFNDLTPLKTILILRPDVLVKGGDWSVKNMVGAKEVISWGGKVKSLPYLEGKSTTRILRKAQKKSR